MKYKGKKLYVLYDTIFTKAILYICPNYRCIIKMLIIKNTPNIFNIYLLVDIFNLSEYTQSDFNSLHTIIFFKKKWANLNHNIRNKTFLKTKLLSQCIKFYCKDYMVFFYHQGQVLYVMNRQNAHMAMCT